MPFLDREKILQGTPEKIIISAHNQMKENFNEETIDNFYQSYKDSSLHTILECSRYIFSEPTKGLPFYKQVMESGCVPYDAYYDERQKVKEYLEAYGSQMNTTTKNIYSSLYEFVDDLYKNHKQTIVSAEVIKENPDVVLEFCESSYDYLFKEGTWGDVKEKFDSLSPFGKILYTVENAKELDLEQELMATLESVYTECVETDSIDDFSSSMDTMMLVNNIMKDKAICESVNGYENKILKMCLEGLMKESPSITVTESVIAHDYEEPREIENAFESVNAILENQIDKTDSMTEVQTMWAYENVLRQYITCEHCLDYLIAESMNSDSDSELVSSYDVLTSYAEAMNYDPSTLTIEDGISIMAEATSELEETLAMMEYTRDGQQSTVMQHHATSLREEKDPKRKTVPSEKSDRWKENMDDHVDYSEYDDEQPKGPQAKPKMKKQDLHTRIQAKALDADVKAKSVKANLKKLGSDVIQTGKAILRVPGNVLTSIKDFIHGWKNLDETKRKEYMLKPGYRRKFYKTIKWALTYYVSFAIHPLLAIWAYFARKASKEKNQFLRNELAMELDTEISICDAKIEDAQNKDDQKQKYQLMRIRDKLKAEKTRVVANAKYV